MLESSFGEDSLCHSQLHQYREAYGAEKEVYVEFIDVGGHRKYEISRSVFYYDVHGAVCLVVDCRGCGRLRAVDGRLNGGGGGVVE